MSKSQYIFNPDTDLALADGDENYIPPYSATKMAKDLASLPRWYDIEDSRAVIPWGWNPALIKKLKAQGIAPDLLPDKEKMERIRQLSHRSLSVHLQKELLTSMNTAVPQWSFHRRSSSIFCRKPHFHYLKSSLVGKWKRLIILSWRVHKPCPAMVQKDSGQTKEYYRRDSIQ